MAGGAGGGGIARVAVIMVGGVVRSVVGFQIMSIQIMSFHEVCLDCQFSWRVFAGRFWFILPIFLASFGGTLSVFLGVVEVGMGWQVGVAWWGEVGLHLAVWVDPSVYSWRHSGVWVVPGVSSWKVLVPW